MSVRSWMDNWSRCMKCQTFSPQVPAPHPLATVYLRDHLPDRQIQRHLPRSYESETSCSCDAGIVQLTNGPGNLYCRVTNDPILFFVLPITPQQHPTARSGHFRPTIANSRERPHNGCLFSDTGETATVTGLAGCSVQTQYRDLIRALRHNREVQPAAETMARWLRWNTCEEGRHSRKLVMASS